MADTKVSEAGFIRALAVGCILVLAVAFTLDQAVVCMLVPVAECTLEQMPSHIGATCLLGISSFAS